MSSKHNSTPEEAPPPDTKRVPDAKADVDAKTDLDVNPVESRLGIHNRRFFLVHISWRLATSMVFGALLGVVLHIFEDIGILDPWQRRGFNTLAILLSSTISLSLGSLLGLLGSMLRWPLLARVGHTPQDVSATSTCPSPLNTWARRRSSPWSLWTSGEILSVQCSQRCQ